MMCSPVVFMRFVSLFKVNNFSVGDFLFLLIFWMHTARFVICEVKEDLKTLVLRCKKRTEFDNKLLTSHTIKRVNPEKEK